MKIGVLAMMLLLTSSVMALDTGFYMEKNVVVTGDWKWDNGWVQGNFPTASLSTNTWSHDATQASVSYNENLGQAWKYDLNSLTQVNAKTTFVNSLNAITVNPPTTTPATGGWTHFSYVQNTAGVYSQSQLSLSGYGAASVNTYCVVNSPAMQQVKVDIN